MRYAWKRCSPGLPLAPRLPHRFAAARCVAGAQPGFDPRDVNPHLLGVENVYKLVGPAVAVSLVPSRHLQGPRGRMVGALTAVGRSGLLTLDPLCRRGPHAAGRLPGFSAAANAPVQLGVLRAWLSSASSWATCTRSRFKGSAPRVTGGGGRLAALFGLACCVLAGRAGHRRVRRVLAPPVTWRSPAAGSVALALRGVLAARRASRRFGAGFVRRRCSSLASQGRQPHQRRHRGAPGCPTARAGPRPEHGAVRLHGSPAHLRRRVAAALQSLAALGGQAVSRARHPAGEVAQTPLPQPAAAVPRRYRGHKTGRRPADARTAHLGARHARPVPPASR